jgi:hypothetical protein
VNRLRLHLIACRVFERELDLLAGTARTDLQIQYLDMALHERPGEQLRAALQAAVEAVSADRCEAIGLGYGLCNRGLVGLEARSVPLVIPRAHDCLGLLLGSSTRYLAELEAQPGTYFQSSGWIEHLPADRTLRPLAAGSNSVFSANREELIARYGEENAAYLLQELADLTRHYRRLAFISTPVPGVDERESRAREIAARQGWDFERLPGDVGWLRRLVDGEWTEREFLVLPPGRRVGFSHDDRLIVAEPLAGD